MKILLTGASGLLGHAYAQAAVRRGHSVTALYNQNRPIADGLTTTTQLDVSQPGELTNIAIQLWPDVIVNCAAISTPPLSSRREARRKNQRRPAPTPRTTLHPPWRAPTTRLYGYGF